MRTFIIFAGKIVFFFLLVFHFIFLGWAMSPISLLLASVDQSLTLVDKNLVPAELIKLENEKDLVPTVELNAKNKWGTLGKKVILWRQEHLMDANEKLALNLSLLDFGEGIVGITAASEYYFGQSIESLTPEQWVMLVNFNRIFLK